MTTATPTSPVREARQGLDNMLSGIGSDINRVCGEDGIARMRGHASRARDILHYATGRMKIRHGDYGTIYGPRLVVQLDRALDELYKARTGREGKARDRLEFAITTLGDLRDELQTRIDAIKDAEAEEKAARASAFPRDKERRDRLQDRARLLATGLDLCEKWGIDITPTPEYVPEVDEGTRTRDLDGLRKRLEGAWSSQPEAIKDNLRKALDHMAKRNYGGAWAYLEEIAGTYEEAAQDG
jgi:hypothetical protein